MAIYTAAEYAKKHGITIATARKRLNEMVISGAAWTSRGIIGHRSAKRGARSRLVPVYGIFWRIE